MLTDSKISKLGKIRLFYLYQDFLNIMPIHTFEIITQLANNGHEVFLFGCIDKKAAFFHDLNTLRIKVIKVPYWPIRAIGEAFFLLLLFIKIIKNILNYRPDIIYIRHGSLSIIGAMIRRIFRIPICIEVNDILLKRTEFRNIPFLKSIWIYIYEKLSFSLADRIFPVTKNISNWIKNQYSVKRNCIVTIPNGVNIKRFYPMNLELCRNKFEIAQNKFVVGYLGSLFHWAGIEYLIDAAKLIVPAFPNALFVIGGGEQPYLAQLTKKVQKDNLDDYFKFFGTISWDEASDFINTFDIGVAPVFFKSLESGISSQKVFAYLSCGKPVIGSDIPGLGNLLKNEGIGISFPMGHSVSLSRAIIMLIQNRKEVENMSKRAKKFVVNKCSWEIVVNQIEKHFFQLLGNHNR